MQLKFFPVLNWDKMPVERTALAGASSLKCLRHKGKNNTYKDYGIKYLLLVVNKCTEERQQKGRYD